MPKLLSILLIALFVALGSCSDGKKKKRKKSGGNDEVEVPLLKRTGEADEDEDKDESNEASDDNNDDGGESLTDQANALADTICACKDKECLKGLRKKGSAIEKEARDGSEADRAGVAASKQRAKACIRSMRESANAGESDDGPSLSQRADALATEICACKDMDCAKNLVRQGNALEEAAEAGSEDDQRGVGAAKRRAKGCIGELKQSLTEEAAPAEPVPAVEPAPTAEPAPAAEPAPTAASIDCTGANATKCLIEIGQYQSGTGGKTKDVKRAIAIAEQLCADKNATGCVMAGGLSLQAGGGLETDRAKAGSFFAKACKLGQKAACASAKALGATVD